MSTTDRPRESSTATDVGQLLHDGQWSPYQKAVVAVTALAIIFDGFDNQLIGYAIPVLISEWGLPRAAFAPVLATGLIGMTIGSILGGWVGDRLGRRVGLIGSVFLFGVATVCVSMADSILTLVVLRFLTGLGVGGALPNASAVAAEFTPVRRRAIAVTLTIVCVPLGGMLAGVGATNILPALGWRWFFAVGGMLPISLAIFLLLWFPESPRFLVRHRARWNELATLLARMRRPVTSAASFVDSAEPQAESKSTWVTLVAPRFRRDSIGLWIAFFFCLGSVYTAFSWLPTLLTTEGLDLATAGSGLLYYNLGGVIGAVSCASFVAFTGSRVPMALAAIGGAATAAVLATMPLANASHAGLLWLLGLHGLCVNAVQTMLYALAAHVYVTSIRASGVAVAASIGRLATVLSAFVGAAVIQGGSSSYFRLIAGAMIGALVGVLLVRNHFSRRGESIAR